MTRRGLWPLFLSVASDQHQEEIMEKTIIRRAIAVLAAASLSLAIGVGSAGATKPEGTPGNSGNAPGKAKVNASRACKAERTEIGVDAFREKYGTNKNGKNAFGKCVSSKKHSDGEDDPAST
jgi:hypothetical protein